MTIKFVSAAAFFTGLTVLALSTACGRGSEASTAQSAPDALDFRMVSRLAITDATPDQSMLGILAQPVTAKILYVATKDSWRCRDGSVATAEVAPWPFFHRDAKSYFKTADLRVEGRTIKGSIIMDEGDCAYKPVYLRLEVRDAAPVGAKAVELRFGEAAPKAGYRATCEKVGREQYTYCHDVQVSLDADDIEVTVE